MTPPKLTQARDIIDFQPGRFSAALIEQPWLLPLRESYHQFDAWFLQKAGSMTPLWAGVDPKGNLVALLYTKRSARITLRPDVVLTHPNGYLKIGMICTAKARQGLGRACVAYAIAQARQLQVHAIYATTLPDLQAPQSLFSALGFACIGEKRVKGQVHLVYQLCIDDALHHPTGNS